MKTLTVMTVFLSVVVVTLGIAVIVQVHEGASELSACNQQVVKLEAEKQEMIDYMGAFLPKKFRASE